MPTTSQYDENQIQRAGEIDSTLDTLGSAALTDPSLGETLMRTVDLDYPEDDATTTPFTPSADGGLADLVGLGAGAPVDIGKTEISAGVINYDDTVAPKRIMATADLYYLYMHECIGIFRVMYKLQELFRAGSLRISDGPGAFGLYRFDRHSVLRYHHRDRFRAYKRVLGYGRGDAGMNARPNPDFHPLLVHFIGETAKYWRDKRISEVVREKATDPTFGSIAIVRRAGLDLRNNVKNSSFGYVSVMRIETSQALAEAFKVLDSPDVKAQFGADTPWDVVELVMWQYFQQPVSASTMNRMAVAGREIIKWLAQDFVLKTDRRKFEAALYQIAELAEEWISSEEGLRLTRPTPPPRNVFRPGPPPRAPGQPAATPRRGAPAPRRVMR